MARPASDLGCGALCVSAGRPNQAGGARLSRRLVHSSKPPPPPALITATPSGHPFRPPLPPDRAAHRILRAQMHSDSPHHPLRALLPPPQPNPQRHPDHRPPTFHLTRSDGHARHAAPAPRTRQLHTLRRAKRRRSQRAPDPRATCGATSAANSRAKFVLKTKFTRKTAGTPQAKTQQKTLHATCRVINAGRDQLRAPSCSSGRRAGGQALQPRRKVMRALLIS